MKTILSTIRLWFDSLWSHATGWLLTRAYSIGYRRGLKKGLYINRKWGE